MGQFIVKLADHYLLWSTIVDAPVTIGMTLDQLRAHIQEREGLDGLRVLPSRLERVDKHGSSSVHFESTDEICWLNRAGLRETALTRAQLIDFYVTQKAEGEPPLGVDVTQDCPSDEWSFAHFTGERHT